MLKESDDYYVYAICYPDGEFFYIGKGIGDRAIRHLKYTVHNPYVKHVIANIREEGQEPSIHYIKTNISNEEAKQLEIDIIAQLGMRIDGGQLTNLHFGGTGGRPSELWTDEQRKRLSDLKKGHRLSEQHKLGLKERMKGNTLRLGVLHTDETKEKISKTSTGRKLSEEAKTAISNAKKGDKNPMWGKPGPRKGVVVSEETRRKLSEAAKNRFRKGV